jgi:tetratricopeptide (TPR) repeat protein
VTRDPEADRAAVRLVYEATQRGDHAQAGELAQQALAQGLEHPLLYNVAALALDRSGELTQALSLLEQAVRAWPDDLGVRNALGLALLRLERPAAALEQFEALLRLNPDLAFAHTSRGNALLALGAITEAEGSFKRALELDPQQAVAHAGLARIATNRGNYRDAHHWAELALTLLPGYPDAVMSLAATELREHHAKQAEERIRALLADSRLSPRERAYAQGLLGDTLDVQQRQEEAFAAYTGCNQQLQRLYADHYRGEDNALDYVRAITSYFEKARPEDWRLAADPAAAAAGASGHVFVLGFPRSGTTLLEVILEGHPDVVSLEENELLIDSVRRFMRTPADVEHLRRATAVELAAARTDYWRLVAAGGVSVAGKVFVDKHPLNTLKLPLIARLFPHAKILFACRDPRDIVLSCFRHRFRMSAPIFELLTIEGAARYYDAVMQLLVRLTSLLTFDVCLVRHEDVVMEFAREMKRVCDFLGLQWDPAMGDFALRTQQRPVLTPSTVQLVRGLSTEGVGQWRRYRSQLAPVQSLLAPWVKRFYYDPQ